MNKNIKKVSALFLMGMFIFPLGLIAQTASDLDMYTEVNFVPQEPTAPDVSSLPTFDQSENIPTLDFPTVQIDPKDIKEGELASCFDYYTFGSIDINLSTDFPSYESGRPVLVRGVITNKNTYPVVGLDIKARLVKDIPAPDYSRSEIIILNEFDIAENITLDANEQFNVSSSLLLPLNTPSGDYQLLFYAVEQDRFNLAGLSFTNDVVASKLNFSIKGNKPDHVYLDQTQITVGGQPHNVMAFMTQHKANTQVPVSIPLYNPENKDVEMTVTYNLYSWDSANSSNRLNTKTEQVLVPAKKEFLLTYVVEDTSNPVYYLSISAEPTTQTKNDSVFKQKTISNIRFAVDELSKPRLNFAGVDSYPLKKGIETTLVTCFHNTSNSIDSSNTRIETTVYDQNNRELSRIEYQGKVTPDISGLINKFTPSRDISNFTVISKMYDTNGQIIDVIEKKYDCKDINESFCPQTKPLTPFMIIALIGVIIGLCVLVYKRKTVNLLRV